jgi:hypothetical protein
MTSDLVSPSVEQRCIIIFLVKEEMKPAEILCRLIEQYGEEALSRANVSDLCSKFPKGHKEVKTQLLHG